MLMIVILFYISADLQSTDREKSHLYELEYKYIDFID